MSNMDTRRRDDGRKGKKPNTRGKIGRGGAKSSLVSMKSERRGENYRGGFGRNQEKKKDVKIGKRKKLKMKLLNKK